MPDGTRKKNIGWIPYWNLLPLRREMLRRKLGVDLSTFEGVPSKINSMFRAGEISVAPCSSICLLTNPASEIAFPLGVSSDGPVQSVYLGFQKEHEATYQLLEQRTQMLGAIFNTVLAGSGFDVREISRRVWDAANAIALPLAMEIPSIKFSSASATSVALVGVLRRLWFGAEGTELQGNGQSAAYNSQRPGAYGRRPIELVIGDEALIRRPQFHRVMDLGSVWKRMTGLPFVYAVWQTSGSGPCPYKRHFLEAGELAEARMKVEPAVYYPGFRPVDVAGKEIDLASYWSGINYRLGPQSFLGLSLFLSLAREFQPAIARESSIVKMLRWQEMAIRSQPMV